MAERSTVVHRSLFLQGEWKEAKSVLLYEAMAGEVASQPMIDQAIREGKNVAVVDWQGEKITPRWISGQAGAFDLIVLPGLAFDHQGYRLGRGRGHYDRFLEHQLNVTVAGVCFAFQFVEQLPVKTHDICMSYIVHDDWVGT